MDFVEHERRRSGPRKDSFVGDLDEWEAMLAEVEAEILAISGDGGELESFRREREQMVQRLTLAMPERWPQHVGGQQLSPDGKYLFYKIYGGPPRGIGGNYAVQGLYVANVLSRPVKLWKIEPPVSAAYWHANGRQLVVRVGILATGRPRRFPGAPGGGDFAVTKARRMRRRFSVEGRTPQRPGRRDVGVLARAAQAHAGG